jgi:hypothetical protein
MGAPVPPPSAAAVARMQADRDYQKHTHSAPVPNPLTAFRSNPDVSTAARAGEPTLNPPDDAVSATDVLKQGAAGPAFGINAQRAANGDDSGNNPSSGEPNIIEGPASPSVGGDASNTAAVQIIEAPSGPPSATPDTPSTTSSTPDLPTAVLSNSDSAPASAAAADPAGTPAEQVSSRTAPATQTGTGSSTSSTSASQNSAKASASTDPQKESTSKKKKGLHKLIPF